MDGKIPGPFDEFWLKISAHVNLVETVDNLLSSTLHNEMKAKGKELEDSYEKDWRADRSGLLEVVDPFLYSYIDEVTHFTWTTERKFQMPCLKIDDEDYSKEYQLLPAEFFADKTTKKVRATSYINNLDPRKHRNVYDSIELVIEKALPQFEKVLTGLVQISGGQEKSVELSGRPLQIIVAMKSVHLTPNSNPRYEGSSWHTECLKNERIVASAVYYYDVDNIKDSQLAFKVQTDGEGNFAELGHVTAESNRLVVFPNIYEHIVRPFELKDKSKDGHRKIITLFLVDPDTKIISTADVPPQQKSWYPITEANSSDLFPEIKNTSASRALTLDAAKGYRVKARAERSPKTITPKTDDAQNAQTSNAKPDRKRPAPKDTQTQSGTKRPSRQISRRRCNKD